MNILDKIRTADPKTRVSFLHPDRAAESICDIQELRDVIKCRHGVYSPCAECDVERERIKAYSDPSNYFVDVRS